ncbi:hemerythrin domain-containing protein [Streptomyces spongiae]|uniref:hemerythrin domain-containing protein n=1 Tax=Streptomyces spongiae TaxID=565072 RepID=UPI001D135398|nr:hemerythrin domain-containing protein [Streptomyces spongiae]
MERHHNGENDLAFVKVAEQFPELLPVLEELQCDHQLADDSLQRLETLVAELDRETDPTEFRRELDSLAALIETHFTYEERRIISALNALKVPSWDRTRPAFLLTDD